MKKELKLFFIQKYQLFFYYLSDKLYAFLIFIKPLYQIDFLMNFLL